MIEGDIILIEGGMIDGGMIQLDGGMAKGMLEE